MKTTILLLIICLSTFSFSQNNFGYKHTNGTLNDCTVASNGDYLVTGKIYSHISDYFIARISPAGDTLWTKTIWRNLQANLHNYEESFFVKELPNGEIIISGNNTAPYFNFDGNGAEIYKLSALGEVIWSREIPSSVNSIVVNSNNEIIFTQNSAPMAGGPRKEFIKIDFDGNLLWSNCFSNTNFGFVDVVELADSNLLLLAENHFILFDTTQIEIRKKIDFPSNVNTSQIYFKKFFLMPNNDLILFGTYTLSGQAFYRPKIFAARFNSSGILIWSQFYEVPVNLSLNITSKITQSALGNFVFTLNIREIIQNQIVTNENCILEIDQNGDIQNVIPIHSSFNPIDVEQTPDSSYLLVGTINNISYLLKSDSTYQSICFPFQDGFSDPLIEITQGNILLSNIYYQSTFNEQSIPSFFIEILDVSSVSGSQIEMNCLCDSTLSVPQISTNDSIFLCFGDTVTLDSEYQENYLWSTGDTTQSISVSQVGTYFLLAPDGNCLLGSNSISINLHPKPIITFTGSLSFCVGDSVLLSSSYLFGNTWSTGDTTQSIYVKIGGSYTVSHNQENCSSTSNSILVTPRLYPPIPTISTPSTVLCQGSNVVLTSSSIPSASVWSNGVTSKYLTVITTGLYSLSVSSNNCTSYSDTIEITIDTVTIGQQPIVTASTNSPYCLGDTLILTSSIANVIWSTGETTQSIKITNTTVEVFAGYYVGSCYYNSPLKNYYFYAKPVKPVIQVISPTCSNPLPKLSTAPSQSVWSTGSSYVTNIQITENGYYSTYYSNQNGCKSYSDSIYIELDTTPINYITITSSQASNSICQGDTITLSSSLPTGNLWLPTGDTTQTISVSSAGTYSVSDFNNHICSNQITISIQHPSNTPIITGNQQACAGESVILTSSYPYYNYWSTGETTTSIEVFNSDTIYLSNAYNSCTPISNPFIIHFTENISPPTIHDTICEGETYNFNNQQLNISGEYYETFTSTFGCDSTVSLSLIVFGSITNLIDTICFGTNYNFGSQILFESGDYSEVLATSNGCSSVLNLSLVVLDSIFSTFSAAICDGESYNFGSQTLNTAGNYYETFTTSSGCDSTVNLSLLILDPITTTFEITICQGESYSFGSQTLTTAGNYYETFTTSSGCDSTVNLSLLILDPITTSFPITICYGESYTLGSHEYFTTGNYYETFTSSFGCDSNVVLFLNVNQPLIPIVEIHGDTLVSSANSGNQWYLEDFSTPIPGATNQIYITTESGNYYLGVTDSIGCTAFTNEASVIDYSASLSETKIENQIQVIPNPTSDKLTIITEVSIEKIRIINLLGELINEFEFSSTIDVSQLANGVYYLCLMSKDSTKNIKIIKE